MKALIRAVSPHVPLPERVGLVWFGPGGQSSSAAHAHHLAVVDMLNRQNPVFRALRIDDAIDDVLRDLEVCSSN